MVYTSIQTIDGNVGIGTSSTTYALDVRGPTSLEAVTTSSINIANITYPFIPSGMIAMWSGSTTSLPAGWSLCDGGGTPARPNLKERFILGYGTTYAQIGATGGQFQKSISTSIMASHSHPSQLGNNVTGHGHNTSSGAPHTHNTQSDGKHDHQFNTSNTQHAHNFVSQAGSHQHTNTAASGSHLHYNYIVDTRISSAAPAIYNAGGSGSWWTVYSLFSYDLANRPTEPAGHTHAVSDTHQHNMIDNNPHYHNTDASNHTHQVIGVVGPHTHQHTPAGTHSHTLQIGQTGNTFNIDCKPPYYVLAYIIKD